MRGVSTVNHMHDVSGMPTNSIAGRYAKFVAYQCGAKVKRDSSNLVSSTVRPTVTFVDSICPLCVAP